MDECPYCGSDRFEVVMIDGASVRECGLCGERVGDARAVSMLATTDDAAVEGFDAAVYPLVRVLRGLRGLAVEAADAGDPERATLPRVELTPTSASALAELEHVVTSLRLGAAARHCDWLVEVRRERALTFVLRPQRGGSLKDARLDLETLARQFERDMGLSWWRAEATGG